MAELYDASGELIPSVHELEAAIKSAKHAIDYDGGQCGPDGGMGDGFLSEHGDCALFCMRFTKAALSGEVSEGVENKGCDEFLATWPWLRTEIDTGAYGVMPPEPLNASFKAMCTELAKEVGGGRWLKL